MIKMIRSYLAFTSKPYRVVLFLLAPVVVIGLQMLLGSEWIYMEIMLLLYIETVADHFVFGGIAAKNMGFPEYIKASCHGREVFKMALAGNMVRQLAESAAVLGITLGIFWMRTGETMSIEESIRCLTWLFLGCLIVTLTTTVARFFEAVHANLLLATIGIIVYALGLWLVMNGAESLVILFGVLTVIAEGISIRIITKRVEESYYDRID